MTVIPLSLSFQTRAIAFLGASSLLLSPAAIHAEIRPALLGNGPTSLINVLSAERLLKRGQKDGVLKFDFFVSQIGEPYGLVTFGGSENTDVLSQELVDQIERARFIPASYHGENVGSFMVGTLVFAISGGTPRLRIFLNQERERLNRGEDFIAPQQVFPRNDKFQRFDDRYSRVHPALIAIKLDTDVSGKILGAKLLRVHPPRSAIGAEVVKNVVAATMSPGYLHGRPVACSTTWTIPLQSYGRNNRWLTQAPPRLIPGSPQLITNNKPARSTKSPSSAGARS